MENILSLRTLSLGKLATNEKVAESKAVKAEIDWKAISDSFLLVAFAVGVYSQLFSFFAGAFLN